MARGLGWGVAAAEEFAVSLALDPVSVGEWLFGGDDAIVVPGLRS